MAYATSVDSVVCVALPDLFGLFGWRAWRGCRRGVGFLRGEAFVVLVCFCRRRVVRRPPPRLSFVGLDIALAGFVSPLPILVVRVAVFCWFLTHRRIRWLNCHAFFCSVSIRGLQKLPFITFGII